MSAIFLLLVFFLNILGAHSIVYVIDLDELSYKNLCYEISVVGNCTSCKIKFADRDQLILVNGSKTVWESEKHHVLENLIISSSCDKLELVLISFKDNETNETKSVHFYQTELGFIKVDKSLYHKLAEALREDSRKFDVNIIYDNWYVTVEGQNHKLYNISPGIKVNKVVDRLKVIWKNETECTVAGVKVRYSEYNEPESCEVICYDKVNSYRYCYFKDDLDWHYVNTIKAPASSYNPTLDSSPQSQAGQISPRSSDSDEQALAAARSELEQIVEMFREHVLMVTLSNEQNPLIPDYTDVGDYIICGMKSRVYNTYRAAVTHVCDGTVILWRKKELEFLHKVTLYRSHDSKHLLVEIEYMVKTDHPMKTVKGLKAKHRNNQFYTEYTQYVKTDGKWTEFTRINFVTFKQELVRRYVAKNRHLRFDGSFVDFFEEIYLPPRELDIRTNISYSSIKSFFKSLYHRYFKEYVPISYDINDTPFYLFEVKQHYIFSQFYLYTLNYPYAIFRLLDGDQIIWSQTEDGLGCRRLFLLRFDDEAFLHLEVDSRDEPHRYYHQRKGYWHVIEPEEHLSLINLKAREYIGDTFLYNNHSYILDEDVREWYENRGFSDQSV